MSFVYVLKCNDNSYYVGAAPDYKKRLNKHNKGLVKYTKSRLPVVLVFLKHFNNIQEALLFESKIKSWKKRKSIEKMIRKSDNLVNNYTYSTE
jgi:putative endonuclease